MSNNNNNNNNAKNSKLVSSSAGTTTIGFSGVSDLGGGMKVGFRVNTDWADVGSLTQDTDVTAGFGNLTTAAAAPRNQVHLQTAKTTLN